MKKSILAVLIVFLMVGVILTSCKNDVNPVGEELVYVSFGEDSSRALIATLEDFDADDYWWSYEAQKNDGSGLISGQTAWDTTGEGAIPVQSGKGLNSVTNNVSAPTKVPGFSKGYWNFRLFAYIDSDRTQLALAYEGEADGVLIDSTNHMVNVVVSPVGVADGYLQIGEITFNPASASSSAASVVSTDTVYKLQGETWVDTGATPDSTGKYTLPAGQYKFSRIYSYEDIPVANGSVIVTVYSNLTTTISGSLSELTTFATFGADQNPDIITTTIGTESITMGTDTESVEFKSSSQTETKVTASMPTEAAQSLITELEKEMGAKPSSATSTTSNLTLNLSVNTTEATESTITYEIGMEATLVYQKIGPSTATTTTTTTVEELDDFVTVLIEIQRGLSDIKVMHNTTYMTECASLEELLAKTTSDAGADTGFFFYQDPYVDGNNVADTTKAMLYIRTYSFSPFKLSYKLPSYVAAIGSVRYESLAAAFSAAVSGDTVLVLSDVSLGEFEGTALNIGASKAITLDLNGKTISGTATNASLSALLEIPSTSALTIVDSGTTGCISYKSTAPDTTYYYGTYTIYNFGTLTLEAGRIENTTVGGASYAVENHVNWTDSNANFYMNGGVVACAQGDQAVRLYANVGSTPMNGVSTMVMKGGTIESGGIWCNMPGQPMGISLTISGGTVNGMLDFISKGNKTHVEITGGTFVNDKIRIRQNVNQTEDYVLISGGTWTIGQIENQNAGGATENTMSITGGTYSLDPSDYVADGYYAHDNGNETWTVIPVPEGSKVRNGNKFYANLSEALADDCPAGSTLVLYDDITDSVSIKISNLTIDLNGNKLTATGTSHAVKISECENVTIKDGSIESAGNVFIIGDHHSAIVKWKMDHSSMSGYHPLSPAKNVILENITAEATGEKSMFYFTNIEDDLRRADSSNPADNDLYGKYIYNGGYATEDLYTPVKQYSEVFIECSDKDKVTIIGGSYTASAMFGHMCKYTQMGVYDGEIYSEVVDPVSGVFSTDEIGRFLDPDKYLIGSSSSSFVVSDTPATSYAGKVNNNYYCYEGGANAAIKYADFGETVYINENSNQEKMFMTGDNLFVVYEKEGISYTGARTEDALYTLKSRLVESTENTYEFYTVFDPVAAVYKTTNNNVQPALTEDNLVGYYPNVAQAFAAANTNGQFSMVMLLRDYEGGDDAKYYYTDKARNAGAHSGSSVRFDLNGHIWTYTGTNNALVITTTSGSSSKDTVILDSKGGGGIYAPNGRCIYKENSSSENSRIKSGTFIAKNQPIYLNKMSASGKSGRFYIEGGTFTSTNSSAVYLGGTHSSGLLGISGGVFTSKEGTKDIGGMTVIPCSISGGTFSSDPSTYATNVTVTKTVHDNGDGTYSVY